jgi:hypothetical protein
VPALEINLPEFFAGALEWLGRSLAILLLLGICNSGDN